MDISAIVLNKLLIERNLDIWSKLKLVFVDSAYSSIYSAISRHYDKYGTLPSFEELDTVTRETLTQKTLATLKLIDEPDISAEVALDALIDQYTQNEAISLLDKFIDKLPIYDTTEIKEELAGIVLKLDEKTLTTEGVYTMADIMLFKTEEEHSRDRVFLGINNTFDAVLGGVSLEELILVGGPRGSGKSIVCSNVQIAQYEMGNTCPYFTIEMVAHETLERNLSILADVNYMSLKNNTLTPSELVKVIKARAEMFLESNDLVEEYLQHRNKFKFETDLVRNKALKKDNQLIIVDDRALTLAALDLHIGKLKARFGEKFKVAVVDYLNQIVVPDGKNQFDWQPQVEVSKGLKNLARKHKVALVVPYQVDDTGQARFAKGILDAPDIALLMKPYDKEKAAIGFETTKIRGGPPINVTSSINWDTLRISPIPIEAPGGKDEPPKKDKLKRAGAKVAEDPNEIPWNA